jgi:Protein of unknown function (DUF3738)
MRNLDGSFLSSGLLSRVDDGSQSGGCSSRPAFPLRRNANRRYWRNATVLDLIRTAYEWEEAKISGGPGWLEWDRFDVVAEVPAAASREDVKVVLRWFSRNGKILIPLGIDWVRIWRKSVDDRRHYARPIPGSEPDREFFGPSIVAGISRTHLQAPYRPDARTSEGPLA